MNLPLRLLEGVVMREMNKEGGRRRAREDEKEGGMREKVDRLDSHYFKVSSIECI